jgi:glycerophosphoryl diester phosphodiesterase
MKLWPLSAVFALFACASVQNRPLLAELELQGHRGARGLAPENTWPAFEAALANGMTVLELDTVLTQDGDLIIHHDTETNAKLCRNSDGSTIQSQPIRTLKVSDLKRLDCGSLPDAKFAEQKVVPGTRLMTLDEFFAAIKKREASDAAARKVAFNVEAKFAEGATEADVTLFADTLMKKVRASGLQSRVTIQSFDHRILKRIKTQQANQRTSALVTLSRWQGLKIYMGLGGGVRADAIESALAVNADILSPYKLYVNAGFVADAHAKKLAVIPWTVNDAGEMQRLIELGVDGIISDYPDRLQKVYQNRAAK